MSQANPLDGAYESVTKALAKEFGGLEKHRDEELAVLSKLTRALGLGEPLPTPSDEEQRVIDDATWRLIAQGCVVAIVQAILRANPNGFFYRREQFSEVWSRGVDRKRLVRRIGLSAGDTDLALRVAAEVLLAGEAFKKLTTVEMDGARYTLQTKESTLDVKRPHS